MEKTHKCAYCGKTYEATKPFSHIIPKQFFKRFKQGIGNVEAYSTYYGRLTQREPVEFLLCHECENVFSKWESEFAKKITSNIYQEPLPNKLEISKDVKLGALSVLWRILHCWAVSNSTYRGSLTNYDIVFLRNYEEKWLDILREQRDFSREEANVFVIPIDCIKSSIQEIADYKLYPGILGNIVFHDQGHEKGYYCVRCLAHRIVIFAYLTSAFSIPREFSIHNEHILLKPSFMPFSIERIFIDYSNDSKKIKINNNNYCKQV